MVDPKFTPHAAKRRRRQAKQSNSTAAQRSSDIAEARIPALPSTARSMMVGRVFLVLTGACQFGHGVGGFTTNFIHSSSHSGEAGGTSGSAMGSAEEVPIAPTAEHWAPSLFAQTYTPGRGGGRTPPPLSAIHPAPLFCPKPAARGPRPENSYSRHTMAQVNNAQPPRQDTPQISTPHSAIYILRPASSRNTRP